MSKWVKVDEGRYKYVDDSDPRPEDREFTSRKREIGAPRVIIKPPWLSRQPQDVATNSETSVKYYNQLDKDSKKWSSSGYWNKYESDRKKYIKSQKQEWIKRGARASDREEIMK